MELLLVSNEDTCRTRIATELLNSFGRGLKITTAGISEGSEVPAIVSEVMQQKGYEVSKKKPSHISTCLNTHWDLVLALSSDAEKEMKLLPIQTDNHYSLIFDDPFEDMSISVDDQVNQVNALYDDMYRKLYEFFRDVISEMVMPRCTCGANTYCRCE